MSGDPSRRDVYCYLITSVEIVKPEQLDITGYKHNFWPGEVVMEAVDYGARPHVQTYRLDDLVSFDCELIRIAIGYLDSANEPHFPNATHRLLNQLAVGAGRSNEIDAAVHQFVDILKERLEPRLNGAITRDAVFAEVDATERDAVRGRARAK